jgi:deoxyribodipyrimidine photo-lyase
MSKVNLWWVRRDIRLYDNAALEAARQHADHLIPIFIIEPELMEKAAPKRRAFLSNALKDLNRQLNDFGSQLIIRTGPAFKVFQDIKDQFKDIAIFAHEDFSPFARQRDEEIFAHFDLQRYPGVVLRHPTEVLKSDGEPYIVYTPFKNTWYEQRLPAPSNCIPTPETLPPIPEGLKSENLPESEPLEHFPATANEAQSRLSAFIKNGMSSYKSQRDRMDLDGTSKLSPYLRFGLISAKEAFAQAQLAYSQAKQGRPREEVQTWMNELVWREFYTSILYHFPHVMDGPFREDYQNIPWRQAPEDLKAWQQGQTGYPAVDACMRQLLATGWMHNRGRMIVASFLTKDLLINWQEGEAWFMANLVDGDPAANNGGWQWSAGTGTDAAPYFRIFNPVTQGTKFDPDGEFIAHWVPELQDLPVEYRHEPWNLAETEAKKFNFKLGRDYPQRIVDHHFARQRTLDAYKSAREQS